MNNTLKSVWCAIALSVTYLCTPTVLADTAAKIDALQVNLSPYSTGLKADITVRYGVRSQLKRIKKPLVTVAFIAENSEGSRILVALSDGESNARGEFATDPNGYANFDKVANRYPNLSKLNSEIDTSSFASKTVSTKDIYLHPKQKSKWKVVFARSDIWVDGTIIGTYETPATQSAKKQGVLPDDWYEVTFPGKYRDLFQYCR